jgi:DNA-binding XRE family transcriptional regulator
MARKNFKDLQSAKPLSPAGVRRKEAIKDAIREAMSLAEVRGGRGRTQVEVAAGLGLSQRRVSQIEQADNVYLSTLRAYVEELGGHLELVAAFGEERVPLRIGGD